MMSSVDGQAAPPGRNPRLARASRSATRWIDSAAALFHRDEVAPGPPVDHAGAPQEAPQRVGPLVSDRLDANALGLRELNARFDADGLPRGGGGGRADD